MIYLSGRQLHPITARLISPLFSTSLRTCSALPRYKARLTLYTKVDCMLCDVARREIERHMHRVHFDEVDISLPDNKFWYRRYRYELPVFHLNGVFLFKNRVNEPLLHFILTAVEKSKDPEKTVFEVVQPWYRKDGPVFDKYSSLTRTSRF